MENKPQSNNFFLDHGSLPDDCPSYISRKADEDLETCILEGRFGYVLTARQMGKSSLRVRISRRLSAQGFNCISVDLTSIGTTNIRSADNWYFAFLNIISRALEMEMQFREWWVQAKDLTPVNKFYSFFYEELFEFGVEQKVVIFIDEIDSLLSIEKNIFSSDDFFAAIRALYNGRADKPALKQLNFVIIGVASPNDLMNDPERTPFNIGESIQLQNFTPDEASVLKDGLRHLPFDPELLLCEVLNWSGGQPVLTQKICRYLARAYDLKGTIPEVVKNIVDLLFLSRPISHNDNIHFLNIQNRIVENERYSAQMIDRYAAIYTDGWGADMHADAVFIYLKLTGIVRPLDNRLIINNKIYDEKFNDKWIAEMRALVNRPYSAALKEWKEKNKSEQKVLRGKALQEFNNWCDLRNDLTLEERQFQKLSNAVEIRKEEQLKLAEVEKEKDIERMKRLDAERKVIRARHSYLLSLATLLFLAALISLFFILTFRSQRQKAEAATEAAIKKIAALDKREQQEQRSYDSLNKKRLLLLDSTGRINDTLLAEIDHSKKVDAGLEDRAAQLHDETKLLQLRMEQALVEKNQVLVEKDSLMRSIQGNVEKANYYQVLNTLEKKYSQLSFFDSTDKSWIVKEYILASDSTKKAHILNAYIDYAAKGLTLRRADPNRAVWFLNKAAGIVQKDGRSSDILIKQIKSIADSSLFYDRVISIALDSIERKGLKTPRNLYLFDQDSYYSRVRNFKAISTDKILTVLVTPDRNIGVIINIKNGNFFSIGFEDELADINYEQRSQHLFALSRTGSIHTYDTAGNDLATFPMPKALGRAMLLRPHEKPRLPSYIYARSADTLYYYYPADSIILEAKIRSGTLLRKIDMRHYLVPLSVFPKGSYDSSSRISQTLLYNSKWDRFIVQNGLYSTRPSQYFPIRIEDQSGIRTEMDELIDKYMGKNYSLGFTSDNDYLWAYNPADSEFYLSGLNKTIDSFHSTVNDYFYLTDKSPDNSRFFWSDRILLDRNNNSLKTISDTYAIFLDGKLFSFGPTTLFGSRSAQTSTLRIRSWDYTNSDKSPATILKKYIQPFEKDFEASDPYILR
jgi:hypothetical protein